MSVDNFDNKVQIKLNVTIKPPTYRPTFSLCHADKLMLYVCVCMCVCGCVCVVLDVEAVTAALRCCSLVEVWRQCKKTSNTKCKDTFNRMRKRLIQRKGLKETEAQSVRWKRHVDMESGYLVPVVSQVDPEDSHAVEDKLHGGQQVVQHRRLPNTKVHRLRS